MNAILWLFGVMLALHPVTIDKVTGFLAWDRTNEQNYTAWYVCTDFAEDLTYNARHRGIEAYTIRVSFERGAGHMITMFNTTDAGLVFVEPQTDSIYYNVGEGNRLCTADENLCMGDGVVTHLVVQP
jgi:hypothetical protein